MINKNLDLIHIKRGFNHQQIWRLKKEREGRELVVSENYRSKTVKNRIFYFIPIKGAYPIHAASELTASRFDLQLKNSAI